MHVMDLTVLDISGPSTVCSGYHKVGIAVGSHMGRVSGNNIGEEGAKALGPQLAKVVNMTELVLNGRKLCVSVAVVVVCCCFGCEKQKHLCACGCVREQHWRGRREGTGSTPGQACEHDSACFKR